MAKSREINMNLPSVDDLFTTQEERNQKNQEYVKNISLFEITDFPNHNHPFKVKMDDKMVETIESIREHGVLVPALVREKPTGGYEMISGHRRKMASELAGLENIPCIVRNLSDDEAVIVMVDSNLQREEILPSEKAFAYKMKLDVMKRQGQRTDLISSPLATKLKGKRSDELLGEEVGESKDQIRRYIRLTYLIPEILDMVDNKKIAMRPAVELSYLPKEEQEILYDTMESEACTPSHAQAIKIRKFSAEGRLNEDTVTLDGLEEGRKYQLKGWQMLKEENAELLIDGKRVESDYTFVADNEKMKVEISYMFDASELGGQNLVTFEELYDLKNPEEPVKVAEHKDIDDEGQTVLITERKILIHTTATDKNGKKEIEAGKDLTIVDTVTLEGLEIGTNYKLSGWQMVKAENAKLLIDGKEVTNDYEFTADKKNMEVQIEFTFDGSTLGGKQLVTFEELYDMTNSEEPKKVTEHKDINDEGQTVTIKDVPETPTPETPGTTTKTSNTPKTGDTGNAVLWIAILVLSAAGITGVRIWNKKKQVKRLGIEEKKEEEE